MFVLHWVQLWSDLHHYLHLLLCIAAAVDAHTAWAVFVGKKAAAGGSGDGYQAAHHHGHVHSAAGVATVEWEGPKGKSESSDSVNMKEILVEVSGEQDGEGKR